MCIFYYSRHGDTNITLHPTNSLAEEEATHSGLGSDNDTIKIK